MHSAPSVNYPVGRSRLVALALVVLWSLGVLSAVAWRLQVDSDPDVVNWRQWLLVGALLVAALGVHVALRAQPIGELRWDGQNWLLEGAPGHGGATASVHFDVQTVMLIRLTLADSPVRWLWLERTRAPERWRALRRALYSRAPPPEPASDAAAAASSSGRTHPDAAS